MNILIEKALHKGLDDIEVQPWLEAQTIRRISEKSKTTFFNFRLKTKYVSIAVCAVMLLITFIGVQPYINNNNSIIPNESGLNQPYVQTPTSSKPDTTEQSGAVYHNIDISQIIRQAYEIKVPFGFFFDHRLMSAKKEIGIGSHWDEQAQFTKEDIESSLHISIIDPILPDGDYTTKQGVLVDDTTDEIIAYRTVYYYFNKDTMEFQNSFSIFYFAEDHFNEEEIEQMQNVAKSNGEIYIDDFSPTTNAYAKVPHVRKLVYLENNVGIVIEAVADAVTTGGKVEQEKSLKRYEQADKQIIALMKSLINLS